MTASEAFTRIEDALTFLGLTDTWGDPINGMEAAGILSNFFGREWEAPMDALQAGVIDANEYYTKMMKMVESYARHKVRSEVEKTILRLREKQKCAG